MPGILFTGPPHQILLAWSEGRFELVFASDVQEECRRVAAELQQQFPRVDLAAALDLVLVNVQAFPPTVLDSPACADPDDDKFLACAVASGARSPFSNVTWRVEDGRPGARAAAAPSPAGSLGPPDPCGGGCPHWHSAGEGSGLLPDVHDVVLDAQRANRRRQQAADSLLIRFLNSDSRIPTPESRLPNPDS